MSGINDIISEIKSILENDSDIADFCSTYYGKSVFVKTGDFNLTDIPVNQIPVIIISDTLEEKEKRRFLFNENEANLLITCGIIQNDIQKAHEELTLYKELIKFAIKKDPLLNDKATYATIVKSKKVKVIPHPLYFLELTMYVNYKS